MSLRDDAECVKRAGCGWLNAQQRLAKFVALLTDPTPVDEAWMREIGATAFPNSAYVGWDYANGVISFNTRRGWLEVGGFDEGYLIYEPTRGQLRSLLFALTGEVKP